LLNVGLWTEPDIQRQKRRMSTLEDFIQYHATGGDISLRVVQMSSNKLADLVDEIKPQLPNCTDESFLAGLHALLIVTAANRFFKSLD